MMSLTSVVIVSACLLIIILMYCVTMNINSMLSDVMADFRIAVFIDDRVSANELSQLRGIILEHPEVTSVIYLTPEENRDIWIEERGINPRLYELLGPGMLRRRLDIYIVSVESVSGVAAWLESPELRQMGISNINHASEVVEQLDSIGRAINSASIAIIAVLAVLSVVIITNTIRLTIDGRKNEISIMKYIGATNQFIRGPFVMEGMLLGLTGSTIAITLVVLFYDGLLNLIIDTFLVNVPRAGDMLVSGNSLFPVLIPAGLLIGGLLGTFSSIATIRRYLDV